MQTKCKRCGGIMIIQQGEDTKKRDAICSSCGLIIQLKDLKKWKI